MNNITVEEIRQNFPRLFSSEYFIELAKQKDALKKFRSNQTISEEEKEILDKVMPVQPMCEPSGLIFVMRSKYENEKNDKTI
jgi:hypothetical protein